MDEDELETAMDGVEHLATSQASRRLTALASAAPKELTSHVQVGLPSPGLKGFMLPFCGGGGSFMFAIIIFFSGAIGAGTGETLCAACVSCILYSCGFFFVRQACLI